MGKRLVLSPHLTVDELQRRYRDCRDPVERPRWQMIWLLASDHTTEEVAEYTGYCRDWVRKIARRYNRDGPSAITDGRRANEGQQPLLTADDEAELAALLAQPHPEGGLWNSVTVAAWIAAKVGRPVGYRRGWKYLRKLGFTPQRPRPRHAQADSQAQEEFKKRAPDEP